METKMMLVDQSNFVLLDNYSTDFYRNGLLRISKHPLLIGISPGNGFFSEQNIIKILENVTEISHKVYVIIPDEPHKANYLGLGYTEQMARKKVKKDNNQTTNRLKNAVSQLTESQVNKIIILDWKNQVESNVVYQNALNRVLKEYENNNSLFTSVNALTENYLISRSRCRSCYNIDIISGAQYYIKEIALFAVFKTIFNDKIVIGYYKEWGHGLDQLARLYPELRENISLFQYNILQ